MNLYEIERLEDEIKAVEVEIQDIHLDLYDAESRLRALDTALAEAKAA